MGFAIPQTELICRESNNPPKFNYEFGQRLGTLGKRLQDMFKKHEIGCILIINNN